MKEDSPSARLGDRFTVLLFGDPVAHSVSPAMHNAAFRALGLDGEYVARRVAPEMLYQAVQSLRTAPYLGANVTVPHKEAAAAASDAVSDRARLSGAVNVLVRDGARLWGDNTDGVGLLAALESTLGIVPYGMRILLLGAGGAARSAAVTLLAGGAASLTIYNRDSARADALARAVRDRLGGRVRAVGAATARHEATDVDLIVNATSAGLDGRSLPLDFVRVRPGAALYDMVYTPSPTPLMQELAAQGANVADGLAMLVAQAGESLRLWTGHEPPLALMRVAADEALRRRREPLP